MRLHDARRDQYRRLAKEQGYKSRAAFKLIEANEKYRIINQNDIVVDFGAAPGGWLQVASKAVGDGGRVLGVDIVGFRLKKPRNMSTLTMDVFDPIFADEVSKQLGGAKADVVLSDLSPTVSGVWELDQTRQVDLTLRVLDLSTSILKKGGKALFKLFEGERAPELRSAFRERFSVVRVIKPAASRSQSSELYYYCEGWLGAWGNRS